nr:reverse transcriptase domain-containing protein [Tanacetum cinerariifolium]
MHVYYAKESPIPLPVIMPPSLVLSPMFNIQEFFLPEELLPPKKQGRDRSSSYTPTLPQEFKIGESSRKTSLERHEEMPPKRTSTSAAPVMTQAAIMKLVADSITIALEAQDANMENADNTNRNPKPREALVARKCSYKEFMICQPFNIKDCKVKFATGTLIEEALSWWNSCAQPIGIEEAYTLSWVEFKKLLIKNIEANVTACKPQTLEEAINIAQRLMDQELQNKGPATGSNLLPVTVTCHAYREKGHYANQCQKTTNNNAQGRAYMLKDKNAYRDPNVVTGMFLRNQHLARVLLDFGADKSFISISLASMLNIPPTTIDTFYNIEMADRNLVSTNTITQGCTLTLLNQPFKIDLMPIKLGSFEVVVGID